MKIKIKDCTSNTIVYEGDNLSIANTIYDALKPLHVLEWIEYQDNNWDVYTHPYDYDEVKIACMLYDRLEDEEIYSDFEDIFKVAHKIYQIYIQQFEEEKINPPEEWMEIEGHGEKGYIQTWFTLRITKFINYFKHSF